MKRVLFLWAAILAACLGPAQAWDATKAQRYASPDMYRPNVDRLIINGLGSTGDVSGMSVAGPGALRTLLDALMDRPSVVLYGVDMTGVKDSTAALTAALNSGKPVTAPCGTIRLVGRVDITVPADFTGAGPCTYLKNDAPAGSAAERVLHVAASATGTRLDNFALTQQVSVKNFAPTTACDGNIICGSAILVQADDTLVSRTKISDAYDNCLAFARLGSPNQSSYVRESPKRPSARQIRTFSCGSSPKREGGGIDVASASAAVVEDHVDDGSSQAFILDTGSGANGTFSNLTGLNNRCGVPGGGSGGTLQSFYIGAGDSTFTNLVSVTPCNRGIWVDGTSPNLTINGYYVKAPGKEAVLIKTGNAILTNGYIDSPGYGGPSAQYAGVVIDTSNGPIAGLVLNGIGFASRNGTQASQGIFQTGANSLEGAAIVTDTTGVASIAAVPPTFKIIQPRNYPN